MVKTGLGQLSSFLPKLKKKRVGVLAHPASVDSQFNHIVDLLLKNKINITQLFGPEHGIRGEAQDMDHVDSSVDSQTGLPVKSLYGPTLESLKPTENDFKNIDVLVCDLQDIGSRYYTFIYTIAFCMQTAAKTGVEVIVLDRPNPINGVDVEGPLVQKGFESFVGYYPLPNRHGMTVGELALLFNTEFNIGCKLQIIKMKGWKRTMYFDDTGLPWVLPSPNMPTLEAALVYPGQCLVEATDLSEGRGTTKPFEFIGAPFIDPYRWLETLNNYRFDGFHLRPIYYRPTFQKAAMQNCGGLQIHITDRNKIIPLYLSCVLLKTLKDLYPNDFKWRAKPYEFVDEIPAIDLLTGSSAYRECVEEKGDLNKLYQSWETETKAFVKSSEKYLLYGE
ncbi:DUF1343 domain-containing protein [bacterium]|nr:DUF1343 domain-containing protein [bacterium]